MINEANVPADFLFDVDLDQSPFKVNEISGRIEASLKKCITITFEPTSPGIYKYNLPCLVLNQVNRISRDL